MTEKLPTIKVFHKVYKIEMVINETDFNKEVHELPKEKTKLSEKEDGKNKKEEDEEAKKLASILGKK